MYQCFGGFYDTACGDFNNTLATDSLNYWERSFFQRMRSLFKFDGLPEAGPGQIGWDYDAFLYQLLRMGYAVVFQTKQYGLVVQPGTPTGYGLQYQPRGMSIASPFFNFDRPLEIGTECAVIKLTPDYTGTWDVIRKYAVEMQNLEIAVRQAALNSRFAYAAVAKNDKDAQTMKTIFQQLQNGKPAVVVNGNLTTPKQLTAMQSEAQLPIMQFDRELKKNFILPELYDLRRSVLMDFYREIGVKIQPDKKERMVVSEADSADAETFNRRSVWKISLDNSLEICNSMYGTSITVEFLEPDPVEGQPENDPEGQERGDDDASE